MQWQLFYKYGTAVPAIAFLKIKIFTSQNAVIFIPDAQKLRNIGGRYSKLGTVSLQEPFVC